MTQRKNLKRVDENLSATVLLFCKRRLQQGLPSFYGASLSAFVEREHGASVAPESAGRILRKLRRDGLINYTVVREESRYTLLCSQPEVA